MGRLKKNHTSVCVLMKRPTPPHYRFATSANAAIPKWLKQTGTSVQNSKITG